MRASQITVVVLLAATLLSWNINPVGAQSSSTGCVALHEVHPKTTAQKALQTQVPDDFKVYPSAEKGGDKLLLRATPFVSGKELANAQAILDPITNRPIVAFRLNTEGASKLAVFSQSNIARPFAIVVDDRVISAPTIQDPILNGEGMISGSFTMAEAQELAAKLMSGACR